MRLLKRSNVDVLSRHLSDYISDMDAYKKANQVKLTDIAITVGGASVVYDGARQAAKQAVLDNLRQRITDTAGQLSAFGLRVDLDEIRAEGDMTDGPRVVEVEE